MLSLIHHIKESKLSEAKLALKTGLELQKIQDILKGDEPTISDIKKISKALKISIDLLISDKVQYENINFMFRAAMPKNENNQYADIFSYTIGNSLKLLSSYKYNDDLLSNFNERLENTYENAEYLANKFRKIFFKNDFFSPILNLPSIIDEELNCILYITEFGQNIDGASAIINKVPYIFISPRFEPRMLYTLAHELGHILAHHDFSIDYVKLDKNIYESKYKDEAFANAFASCLLLPRQGLGITLNKIRKIFNYEGLIGDIEILYLSRIYGVSFEVAARRCEDLGLIPEGGAFSLYQALKIKHGSPERRADEVGIPERFKIAFPKVSSNLMNSAIEKINQGEISIGKASEILSVPIPVIISKNASYSR